MAGAKILGAMIHVKAIDDDHLCPRQSLPLAAMSIIINHVGGDTVTIIIVYVSNFTFQH